MSKHQLFVNVYYYDFRFFYLFLIFYHKTIKEIEMCFFFDFYYDINI
jgi:hypothetical protein